MQRRTWLKLGVASATLAAVAGGSLALLRPGLESARLSAAGRAVFAPVTAAFLAGVLPADGAARESAVQGAVARIDALVANLPDHAQSELSQLLALLASAPGRRWLAGVDTPWPEASVAEVQQGLHAMRFSGVTLRQQAYHALHDIVAGAYFADPSTWAVMGYPGQREV
ncbi:MAG: hypothetical protein HY854_14355 [Burkholderiales bacterium]|nr:hypothetical protein [Burkholderiales bacterium]